MSAAATSAADAAPGLFYAPHLSVATTAPGTEVPVAVQAWGPRFADAALVSAAAALLPAWTPPGRGQVPGQPLVHAQGAYEAWRDDPSRTEHRYRCSCRMCTTTEPEGPTWQITVAPGALSVRTRDHARAERTGERQADAARRDIDMVVAQVLAEGLDPGERPPERESVREITEWSRKSRARMTRTLCELDYAPLYKDLTGQLTGRVPAMVTLTLPGDWLVVAPTGKAFKKLLDRWFKRYERAWGEDLNCIWKMEFQRRGAPHVHLLMAPPHGRARNVRDPRTRELQPGAGCTFREWLSESWADVVDHPDPEQRARHRGAGTGVDYAEGLRASDPKRVSVYFLKHNTAGPDDKEYQHVVPQEWQEPGAGPGRFWGYRGLSKAVTVVEVAPDDAVAAARIMRRWTRAQGRTRTVMRPRTPGGAPRGVTEVHGLAGAQLVESRRTRYRRTTVRAVQVAQGRGWIAVNDGPAFAIDLARYLATR